MSQAGPGVPSGSQGKRTEFHIPSLDGLRAISFLLVFAAHAGVSALPGGFGVTVFFFLSGYLITTLLRMEQAGSGSISFRDFYLRRALRILPPFYLVLTLAVLANVAGLVSGTLALQPMLGLVFHYANYWAIGHGFDGQPYGTGVYWSLAVEEHFYLVFPFLFLLLHRRLPGRLREHAAILLGLCAVVLGWRAYLIYVAGVPPLRTFLASDTRVDSILFGCALALGANPVLDPARTSRRALLLGWFPAGLVLLASTFVFRSDGFRETLRYTLQGIALAPIFVAAIRAPEWGPFPLLNNRIVRRLGVLSYSSYLVHQLVIGVVFESFTWPDYVKAPVALLVSLVLAEAIQRFVEKPCARLRRRLAHTLWMTAPAAMPVTGP